MSHPKNRRDRFLKGKIKAKKRVALMFSYRFGHEHPEMIIAQIQRHRDTTKKCGKSCCANPRHNGFKDRFTLQEKKFFESLTAC